MAFCGNHLKPFLPQSLEHLFAREKGDQGIDRRRLFLAGEQHPQGHRQLGHFQPVRGDAVLDQGANRRGSQATDGVCSAGRRSKSASAGSSLPASDA
jgi:hypothetical protein